MLGQHARERLPEITLQRDGLTHVLPLQDETEARGAVGHPGVLGGWLEEFERYLGRERKWRRG